MWQFAYTEATRLRRDFGFPRSRKAAIFCRPNSDEARLTVLFGFEPWEHPTVVARGQRGILLGASLVILHRKRRHGLWIGNRVLVITFVAHDGQALLLLNRLLEFIRCWGLRVLMQPCPLPARSPTTNNSATLNIDSFYLILILKQEDVVYLAEPLKFTWATGLGERVRQPLFTADNLCTMLQAPCLL